MGFRRKRQHIFTNYQVRIFVKYTFYTRAIIVTSMSTNDSHRHTRLSYLATCPLITSHRILLGTTTSSSCSDYKRPSVRETETFSKNKYTKHDSYTLRNLFHKIHFSPGYQQHNYVQSKKMLNQLLTYSTNLRHEVNGALHDIFVETSFPSTI